MQLKHQALKRIAVAGIIFNTDGEILILHSIEKDGWMLPGGITEHHESPRAACRREVFAETGIDFTDPTHPLSIDYRGQEDEYLMFLFGMGEINDEQVAKIQIPPEVYDDFKFVTPKEAEAQLRPNSSLRIEPSIRALKLGTTAYLENGMPL